MRAKQEARHWHHCHLALQLSVSRIMQRQALLLEPDPRGSQGMPELPVTKEEQESLSSAGSQLLPSIATRP